MVEYCSYLDRTHVKYLYVDAFINIYYLNNIGRWEAEQRESLRNFRCSSEPFFHESFSFPLRKRGAWVIDTVSRFSGNVPNRDIVLFYDCVISFRRFVIWFSRFVIPWFTDCRRNQTQTHNWITSSRFRTLILTIDTKRQTEKSTKK